MHNRLYFDFVVLILLITIMPNKHNYLLLNIMKITAN